MKNRIIRINDIGDIDTSKISVYDLNNRYIDSKGNLFGLKYDRVTKKVEIIKLIRTHTEDANQIQHDMIKKKITETKIHPAVKKTETMRESPDYLEDELMQGGKKINPDTFLDNTLSQLKTHTSRLKGIISSITNSNAYPRENKTDNIELNDIFRSIEIDCIQRAEKVTGYLTELNNYPRSISYYQSKLDKKGRDMLEKLSGDNEKTMRFIRYYEMINSIKELYHTMKDLVGNLENFITKRTPDTKKNLTTSEKHLFDDAVTSIRTTMDEIHRLFDDISAIEEYVLNTENYG